MQIDAAHAEPQLEDQRLDDYILDQDKLNLFFI
jgi:hypothetical protein